MYEKIFFFFYSPQKFASYIQNEIDSGIKIDGTTTNRNNKLNSKIKQKRIPPTLKFESRFESGNLQYVEQVNTYANNFLFYFFFKCI